VRHLIREFQPEGAPIVLMGYMVEGGSVVDPATTRMYPIFGAVIGDPLPEDIMQHLRGNVAQRLTKVYEMSIKKKEQDGGEMDYGNF